jgi:hypothetical protein
MSARVSFLSKKIDAALLNAPPKNIVPASAVAERSGAKVVFVIDGDKVRMKSITLGDPIGGAFEVREGPAPGTRVVRDPPATLSDGQAIKEKVSSS